MFLIHWGSHVVEIPAVLPIIAIKSGIFSHFLRMRVTVDLLIEK